MTVPAKFRSVAIRITGVSAALAVSLLAASTRAEVVSQRDDGRHAQGLAALTPVQGSSSGTPLIIGSAAGQGISPGYHVGPPKPAFSGSILVQPAVPASPLPVHKSGFKHLSGVARSRSAQ